MNNFVIKKPVITEKSIRDAQKGIYTFEVEKTAGKNEIKRAIEEMFKVHVTFMTSLILKGKSHRVGKKRIPLIYPDRKKARVKLMPGEKIDLFEVGESKK